MVDKIYCPVCKKRLIRLEPFEGARYEFWCDTCDLDIDIHDNKEEDEIATEEYWQELNEALSSSDS